MKQIKKLTILLFAFLMIFSLFITSNPIQTSNKESTLQTNKIQQNSCPIYVMTDQIVVPTNFSSVSAVYKYQDYNFSANWDKQTTTNYYTGYYRNDNVQAVIYNVNLADNTQVVVIGYNSKTSQMQVLSDFCMPYMTFGVNPGDSMTYQMTHNSTQAIPFFNFTTTYVSNGDKIAIDVINLFPFQLKYTIGSNPSFQSDQPMFFVLSQQFINESIINYPNAPNGMFNLTFFNSSIAIFTMNNATTGFANFTYNIKLGILINMNGTFFDPQMNPIQMNIQLLNYTESQYNVYQQSNPFGVKVGDTFKYLFTTNQTGSTPFFGVKNGTLKISNRQTVTIFVNQIDLKYNPNQIYITMTIGTNAPYNTSDTMFFIIPLPNLEELIKGGPNLPPDAPTLVSYNDSFVVMKMTDPQGQGQAIVTMDRAHGFLVLFNGVILDPQNIPIQMDLSLQSSTIPVNSTINSSNTTKNATLTTTPGFELIAFIPVMGALIIFRKRK